MTGIGRRNLFLAGGGGLALAAGCTQRGVRAQLSGAEVSAAEFGAVGDGVADDTAALQGALDRAFAGPDATVLRLPRGRYRVTRTLRVRTRDRPAGNIVRLAGIQAHGAEIRSDIADGGPVLEFESRAVVRFVLIEGLTIKGNGREGHGIYIHCERGGRYFYNFCLRDVVVENCGGDGCRMIGNIFEGQIFNCYFRGNRANGATFGHGARNTVLSAVHVYGSVFGDNGEHGAALVARAADMCFHGCYFLLNKRYGLVVNTGIPLLAHCGFENNHEGARGFADGGAGLRLLVGGTLIGCTSYSIYNQTHLVRAFVTNELVMIGCTGSGGDRARGAGLAHIHGRRGAVATLIGCRGRVERQGEVELAQLGSRGGARFGARWDSENLIRLGDHTLWVDESGRLRIKNGRPERDEDGETVLTG